MVFIKNLGGFILICTSVMFTNALVLHLNVRSVLVLFVSIKKVQQAPLHLKQKCTLKRFLCQLGVCLIDLPIGSYESFNEVSNTFLGASFTLRLAFSSSNCCCSSMGLMIAPFCFAKYPAFNPLV